LTLFDKKTAQALLTALVFVLVLLFLYFAWRALIAFLFAIFFAYLLEAPVSRLQKWMRGSRPLAIAAVYLIMIAILVLVISLLGPHIAQETQKLAQQTPEWANRISSGNILTQLVERHGWSKDSVRVFTSYMYDHREQIISALQQLVLRAARTLQNTWWLVLVPILAVFFLKDGDRFRNNLVNSVRNESTRAMVATIVDKVSSMLGHYIRAQMLYSLLAMAVVTFVLWAMGVPYSLALGPAEGALEFIPLVGPLIGAVLIMAVAFLSGYQHLLWVLLFLVVWRVIQDYVTSPRIMSGTLELHPLAVLFGVLAGGEVAGVIGIFLSVPVLAALRIVWHAWQFYGKPARSAETA
jgi:predicted PurR-regulated permease PerM